MFALSAGTSMTRQRAIRRAELLPEPHLKIFLRIGSVRPAESAKNTSRRRDKKTVTITGSGGCCISYFVLNQSAFVSLLFQMSMKIHHLMQYPDDTYF